MIRCLNRRIEYIRVGVPMIFGIGAEKSTVVDFFGVIMEVVLAMMLTHASLKSVVVFKVRGLIFLLVSVDLTSIETDRLS